MFLKKYKIVGPTLVILSLLVALATHSIFTASSTKAFAHITVEVNPKIMMTVDSNEKVVAVDLQNEDAKLIFAEHTLVGKSIDEALKLVTDKLDKSGFLSNDNRVLFSLQPAEGVKKEDLTGVSERILVTLKAELETRNLNPAVELILLDESAQKTEQNTQITASGDGDANRDNTLTTVSATTDSLLSILNIDDPTTWNRNITEAFKDMLAAGFTEEEASEILKNASLLSESPREIYEIASGFVDMKDVGIPYAVSKAIFDMGYGLDQNVFRNEISTLISDLIDMHEVGISSETGIKALVMAIAADRSLNEVSSIISGIIDLKESGVSEAELLSRALRAIEADPTLQNFDDLLGIKDGYDGDEEYDESDYDDSSKHNDKPVDDNDDDYDDEKYDESSYADSSKHDNKPVDDNDDGYNDEKYDESNYADSSKHNDKPGDNNDDDYAEDYDGNNDDENDSSDDSDDDR